MRPLTPLEKIIDLIQELAKFVLAMVIFPVLAMLVLIYHVIPLVLLIHFFPSLDFGPSLAQAVLFCIGAYPMFQYLGGKRLCVWLVNIAHKYSDTID